MSVGGKVAIGLVAAAAAVGGALWVRQWLRPMPPIERVAELAQAGEFDSAAELARERVRIDPDDPGSRLLLAQVLVEGVRARSSGSDAIPDDTPLREALEALEGPRFRDPKLGAEAELWKGKALYLAARYDEAERTWIRALELDPTVPEAGWALLDLYYLQGRSRESRRLALRLHRTEPDPRDRAQLLLELVRQDAQPTAPESLVPFFAPAIERNPGDLKSAVAIGLAQVRSSQIEAGVERLRKVVESHPEDPEAWEGLLTGLDDGGQVAALEQALAKLPPKLADDPRFAESRGRVAQEARDWARAAAEYRRALDARPHDARLEFRLARALRVLGDRTGAEEMEAEHKAHTSAAEEVRSLYEEANAVPTLGVAPHPDLCERLAANRDRMGRPEEAEAWRRIAGGPTPAPRG